MRKSNATIQKHAGSKINRGDMVNIISGWTFPVNTVRRQPMKTLKAGGKTLTRDLVLQDVDFSCKEARETWRDFEQWAIGIGYSPHGEIYVNSNSALWDGWGLKDKPDVQKWLIEKGYAKWVEDDKIRYSLHGRDGTVRLELKDMGDGTITLNCSEMNYALMSFKDGSFSRYTGVPKNMADTTNGRIKEAP